MKNRIRNRLLAGATGALALIGSVNAPLFAEDGAVMIDEVRAEAVVTLEPLDQAQLLADAAKAAIESANASLVNDIVIDLNTNFARTAVTAVAYNEVGQ